MTDTPTTESEATAEPSEDDAQTDTSPEPEPAAQGDDEPEATANSEAARYRVRLREAESQRDALAERLAGYQRRECEAAVADMLEVPADLFEVGGVELDALYDENGKLNDAELRAAADALVELRPRLAKPAPSWGQHSPTAPTGDISPSWADVIYPR